MIIQTSTMKYSIASGAILLFTLLSLTICTNTYIASADTSFTDTISIEVGAACTMEANNTTHSAIVTPGQWTPNIGQSNITTTCNDPGGYAIYAVGYTNDTIGTTDLINTTDSTKTIATNTNKSGNTSGWSMKLGKGTGDTATIMGETQGDTEDFYNDYHIVPSTYTKVAEKTSATDHTLTGTSFTTTYGVFATTSQIAGTYTGQVKYTLVHPNTAPAPFNPQPVACNSGKICYNTNAPTYETPDTMSDQEPAKAKDWSSCHETDYASYCYDSNYNEIDPETLPELDYYSISLWASNFQRSGYGFAGWNTKPDYSGTSYGPNETISFAAGEYSGDNPGLSLYAMWIPSAGNLQDFTTTQCNTLTKANEVTNPTNILTQSLTALTDSRDNQTYAVARLADGNCWMIENLRLDNQYTTSATDIAKSQGYHSSFIGLANPETANFSISTTANSLYSTDGSTSAPAITGSNQAYRFPRYNNQNTANPASNMIAWDNNSNTYSVGNWYTWSAAIADTSYYNGGTYNTTSICPTGWHIPTGGIASEEYGALDVAMGGTGEIQSTTEASMRWRRYPQNFVYSGYFYSDSVYGRGSGGYYWSSTVGGSTYSYILTLGSSSVGPGSAYNRYNGSSIRCLASTP